MTSSLRSVASGAKNADPPGRAAIAIGAAPDAEIFLVDDDALVRNAFSHCFSQAGYRVTCFEDGRSFLEVATGRVPAGVILDVYLPGRSGLQILHEIDAPHYGAPIFMVSGRSDIPTAVEAIRRGAFDFLEKKSNAEALAARVHEVITKRANGSPIGPSPERYFPGREFLTSREHQVLGFIALGASNQEMAEALGISRRTVEVHRAHILTKLKAKNTATLLRIVLNQGRGYS
jgi:two-component system, LuxR family, response regulator FixJ